MACSVVRSPLLRNPTVRHYAAAAATQSSHASALKTQVLGNGVVVAAQETNDALTQVSIVFRAGSRNETYGTQGAAHHLRVAAGLSSTESTTFAITRNIQQLGGNLIATADRESIAYTLQITRNNLGDALELFKSAATQQAFKPWEVSDQLPRMRFELASLTNTTRTIELLHKAAYRTGLGYSLYTPKRQLGKINSETLQHFFNTWCTTSRCAVVATGVPLSELAPFASSLTIPEGQSADEASQYHGGEIRKERTSELATVALAVEGAALKNEKDALACAILQRASGTGVRVKWGSDASPLYKHCASAAGGDTFALSTFNASYSDSGIFGVVLRSTPKIAGSLTKAAHGWLKSLKLSDADISRGKTTLKADVLSTVDSASGMLENLQQQALLRGKVSSIESIAADIDKISPSDVKSVAGKLSGGKLSIVAIGDIHTVPYLSQLS